ncbi:MAG: NADH-quinone oxidoreductase subunit N, partial [Acidobacteriota bacterium]|nr:NADH-quinone oxidoreductase subunit N [Acidobacteriota bacterium]
MAAVSMTLGNLGALQQRDVKRMLAYSSIAHAGYLLVAFTAFPQEGIAAAAFYTAAYAAMNVGAFAVITQVGGFAETARTLEDYTGLATRRPVLASVFAFFLVSLIGIPFTAGFFGKFYVFSAAIGAGHVWIAIIGLLNSGIACFYYLRLLTAIFSRRESADHVVEVRSISVPATIGLTLATLATAALGILPGSVLEMAQYAGTSTIIENARQQCAQHPDNCQLQVKLSPAATDASH